MPPRFGIALSTSAETGFDPVAAARHIEDLGFDFLTVSDHPSSPHPNYESWTLLAWIASATERVGLFPNVLGLPYRHPSLLAKMSESLDRLSGGRLTLGLGAGGDRAAMRAFGLDPIPPSQRIEALGEAVEVMRLLWATTGVQFEGRYYTLQRADIEPKATRRIPVWLGMYGPKGLQLTGRIADGWTPSAFRVALEPALALRERVLEAAERAGRKPEEITCNYNVQFAVEADAPSRPGTLTGAAAEIAGQIGTIVKSGFASVTLEPFGDSGEQWRQRELLATEVIPRVREHLDLELSRS